MYEIWLATNILWELALTYWPIVASYGVVLAGLLILALRARPLPWRRRLPVAVIVGVLVCVASLLSVPGLIGAQLSDLAYWVDWANLFAISAGFGAAAALLAWPLAAWQGRGA